MKKLNGALRAIQVIGSMRVTLRMMALIVMTASSGIALASAWGQNTTITGYFIYENGSAYIRVAHMQNPDGCGSAGYLYVDPSAQRFKEIWAQIMSAHATETSVTVLYSGCSPGGDYPRVGAIAVPQLW